MAVWVSVVFLVTRRKKVGGKRVQWQQTNALSDVRGRGFCDEGQVDSNLTCGHARDHAFFTLPRIQSSLHPDAASQTMWSEGLSNRHARQYGDSALRTRWQVVGVNRLDWRYPTRPNCMRSLKH